MFYRMFYGYRTKSNNDFNAVLLFYAVWIICTLTCAYVRLPMCIRDAYYIYHFIEHFLFKRGKPWVFLFQNLFYPCSARIQHHPCHRHTRAQTLMFRVFYAVEHAVSVTGTCANHTGHGGRDDRKLREL